MPDLKRLDMVLAWCGEYFKKQRPEMFLLFVITGLMAYMACLAVPRVEAVFQHTETQQTIQIDRVTKAFGDALDRNEKTTDALLEGLREHNRPKDARTSSN